jgi:hypothetical protein
MVVSSSGQTTPLCLLAQGKDPILHIASDRVEFNKDYRLPRADQGRKSLPPSYFIIFSFPNINIQIKPDVTVALSPA